MTELRDHHDSSSAGYHMSDSPPVPQEKRLGLQRSHSRTLTIKKHEDVTSDHDSVASLRPRWNSVSVPWKDARQPVYEAWEVVQVGEGSEKATWRTCCGINCWTTWWGLGDWDLHVNPLPGFEQNDITTMVAVAEARNGKGGREAYAQDLADRAYNLPRSVYIEVYRLTKKREYETSRNPRRQRTWQLVLLQEEESTMTQMVPQQRKKGGLLPWTTPEPPVRRWFIVIKGQEVVFVEDGRPMHGRWSNPWSEIDKQDAQELAERQARGEKAHATDSRLAI